MLLESYIRITFSYSYTHDMINSAIEIPKVRVKLPEWPVMLHLYKCDIGLTCEEMVAHATFSWDIGLT